MKHLFWVSSILLLTSCGGWSDTDKMNFKDRCEKSKFSLEYCDCALEKAMNKYGSFNEMSQTSEDEISTLDLFIDCLDKDSE